MIKVQRDRKDGPHSKIRVWSGPDLDHLGYSGSLVLTHPDWLMLAAAARSMPYAFSVTDLPAESKKGVSDSE